MRDVVFSVLNGSAVLQLLSQSITTIKLVFRFYMLHSIYKKDKRSFGMNSSQFQAFAKDCRLNQAGMNMVGVIFKTVSGQVISFHSKLTFCLRGSKPTTLRIAFIA